MTDPLGFVLLLLVGLLAVVVAVIGLRRGSCVGLAKAFRPSRAKQPIFYWYGITFQGAIGLVALGLAISKALK